MINVTTCCCTCVYDEDEDNIPKDDRFPCSQCIGNHLLRFVELYYERAEEMTTGNLD